MNEIKKDLMFYVLYFPYVHFDLSGVSEHELLEL
jgi:hypothetical protein